MCLWYRQFLFQSTLPREERQQTAAADVKREDISIHAPTRGATQKLGIASVKMYDFNPRSHERSDPCGWCYRLRQIYFNPRSHERSDGDVNKIDCGGSVISIHAPTRGATFVPRRISRYIVISIHAPTRGATYDQDMYNEQAVNFNPRSHERSDCQALFFVRTNRRFQSTLPREERHAGGANDGDQSDISIHAPTRGATLCAKS